MGQVFTIMFDFRKEQQVAVVTVCNKQLEEPVYYVRLFNPELQKIIPGGRIRFSSSEHYQPDSLLHPWTKDLFLAIRDAVFINLKNDPTFKRATLNSVIYDKHLNTPTS